MLEWPALFLSLQLASLTTLLLLLFGLPLTFFLSQSSSRAVLLVEVIFSLPLVLPPTVLGFYLLLLLSSVQLAFTFKGLLIASLIYSLPFALQPFLAAFQAIDPRWLEASWVLGESKVRTFWRVAIPLAKEGILAGAILAFAHALGEFGVVLMIGGNIPQISRTLSVALYDQVEAFDYQQAHRTALVLLSISVVALVGVSWLKRKAKLL